jgi:hypothetical protein
VPCVSRGIAALILLAGLAQPAASAVLVSVVSGLIQPVFVGHAGDGTNRLFIVEQPGTIRVLEPGSATPSTFLDVRQKVLSGGEEGLLGLAFHPQYASNRRFFIYYTRPGDGAIVIAEYRASPSNPGTADPSETILLTIPHPTFANHNGGMMAFGPDGMLYIGVGDGGSGNDPPNNAQNIEMLLGKILRINVNQPDGAAGTPYSAPPDNPFVGRAGRDEIFAVGLRNPWRFSFDRLTGQQWVGDVGQDALEEVDTPIVKGGNYGWRVFEGFQCTHIDPTLCSPGNYLPPVLDYAHVNGRCSITGGYVYRGALNALQTGTYVYGDYCTGEIFTWNGAVQTLLFDTPMNISSFGEDQAGELYVVDITGGAISRLAPDPPCAFSVSPASVTLKPGASTTLSVGAAPNCSWTALSQAPWITITAGGSGSGPGTVTLTVAPNRPRNLTGRVLVSGLVVTVR